MTCNNFLFHSLIILSGLRVILLHLQKDTCLSILWRIFTKIGIEMDVPGVFIGLCYAIKCKVLWVPNLVQVFSCLIMVYRSSMHLTLVSYLMFLNGMGQEIITMELIIWQSHCFWVKLLKPHRNNIRKRCCRGNWMMEIYSGILRQKLVHSIYFIS